MFVRNWHSFDVGTNQPVRHSCCQSLRIFLKLFKWKFSSTPAFFHPKNKTRDLRFKILFTISYILSKAGMHLRKFSFPIVMFTGNVIFTCFYSQINCSFVVCNRICL